MSVENINDTEVHLCPMDPKKRAKEVQDILNLIGDKWSLLIIMSIAKEGLRFNEIMRRVEGISQRMLTRNLRELERMGLVWRKVTPSTPPSVEYGLTDLGQTLLIPVSGLIKWAKKNIETIREAQNRAAGIKEAAH